MSHKWKIGDWVEWAGDRHLVVNVYETAGSRRVDLLYRRNDNVMEVKFRLPVGAQFVHLPDCTGWDWQPPKPIEPPEGYRLIREGGFVAKGDLLLANDGNWYECLSAGTAIPGDSETAYARKIEPQYRPFANAAEYEPFFDKVIARSEMGVIKPGGWRPIGYSDIGIYPDVSVMEYADAFKLLKFNDGTPFGVLVNVEA